MSDWAIEDEIRALAEELYALDDDPSDCVGASAIYLGSARFWHSVGVRAGGVFAQMPERKA